MTSCVPREEKAQDPDMEKKSENLIRTDDGSFTLKHHEHGEDYHSSLGALREAEELYVGRSGFLDALSRGQVQSVADIGLGLGYNALATIAAWYAQSNPGTLYLYSLEIQPDLVHSLATGSAAWQGEWSEQWRQWASSVVIEGNCGEATIHHPSGAQLYWQIVIGDAVQVPLDPVQPFTFVWQDAFSPTHNPGMWSADWFSALKKNSASGAVLMTYSVARVVRDALTTAGWRWEKVPGAGTKRQWLKATL